MTKYWYLLAYLGVSSEIGCQTTLYCALDEELANQSGYYYTNCSKVSNSCFNVSRRKTMKNDEIAEKLWDLSCDCVNLDKKKLPK